MDSLSLSPTTLATSWLITFLPFTPKCPEIHRERGKFWGSVRLMVRPGRALCWRSRASEMEVADSSSEAVLLAFAAFEQTLPLAAAGP